jgi:dipeptidyl aminopeptidase/acylaminoacyl peptidase
MTLASAFHYPDRIAGAASTVGISNFRTFLERTETYRRDLRRAEYGDERDPAMRRFLESISPLNHVERMTKPLFVIQGLNDPRVPYTEAGQLVAALKRQGTPAWFMMARDEGHGFAKKPNADYQFYALVEFARRVLLDR